MNLWRKLWVPKLDLYIMRKFLSTFFLSISLIIVIVIVFDVSENIDDFIEKEAPLKEIIFVYYLNFIPYFANLFSALFTFIAVIFFTAKMAARSEFIAILSSGISFRRILLPYLVCALMITVLTLYLNNFLIPITNRNRLEFVNKYIKNKFHNMNHDIHMQISPGTFVYVESYNVDIETGSSFTMEKFSNGILFYKLTANSIQWDSVRSLWQLNNYTVRTINGLQERLISGNRKDTSISMKPADFHWKTQNVDLMNFSELNDFIEQERLKGSESVKFFEVERTKRIAFPFASVVLALIGVSVSSRKVRGGIGLHVAFGISVTFAYILIQKITETFAIYSNWPVTFAVWLPNIAFLIFGFYLLYKAPK